jgi:membrane protein
LNHFRSSARHFSKAPPPPPLRRLASFAKQLIRGRKRLYASSLAFKTLLALVPALAISMAVLSADSFADQREQFVNKIVDLIYPVDDAGLNLDAGEHKGIQRLNQVAKDQIRASVQRFAVHSKKVGLFGLAAFFVVLLLLMRDVEHSFNILWEVGDKRALHSQILRHGILLIGAPLATISVLSLETWMARAKWFDPGFHHWLFTTLVPYLLLGLICAAMYLWIPNTKVAWRSALLAGAVTAFLIETGRRLITWYAVNIVSHSNIYGALWMIPVILLWFYLSWVIILLGAEATYLLQARGKVLSERG